MPRRAVARSARTLVDTVDLPEDQAVLAGGKWKYSCGLEMLEDSIKRTPAGHYVTKNAAIMRLAHTRHHNSLDTDYVKTSRGESHDPIATLYFQSSDGVLIDAWCSCGYDPLA